MKKILALILIIISNLSGFGQVVTIEEPNKSAYYFSDGHAPSFYDNNNNLPRIFTNQPDYDKVNDMVWLKNDKIKIGINLKRGGQIAWASLLNATTNLVYNGYDGGFQVQLDAYQKKDGYQQNGKFSRAQYDEVAQYNNNIPPNNLTSYNVTQGGDFLNHAVTLIDYHKVGTNGYYVKMRPNFYTINSEISRTYIEVTYTLEGYGLKCDWKYTSFRNDGQYDGSGFDGGHAPVCFLVNNLKRFKSYTGNSPWTRDNLGIEDGELPNESSGQTPLTKNSKERWSLVYNPDNEGQGCIGVYANTNETENSFGLKQKEVYNNDRQGGEFGGGYTILGRNYDLVPFLSTFDRTNFVKTISSVLIVERTPADFINRVYEIHGTPPSPSIQISASPTTISAGQSSTLTVGGCNGGLSWGANGGNANPRTVSPALTTNYTVNCNNPISSATVTVSVIVNPTPGDKCPYKDAQNVWKHWNYTSNQWATGQCFAWDAANGRCVFVHQSPTGLVASFNPSSYANSWDIPSKNDLISYGVPTNNPNIVSCFYPSQPSLQVSANPSLITLGQNSALSVSGCNSGLSWADGGNSNPRVVTPAANTTFTVNCSNPSASAQISITVVPPTPSSDKCPYKTGNVWNHWNYSSNQWVVGQCFAWDANNGRCVFAHQGPSGLIASFNPNSYANSWDIPSKNDLISFSVPTNNPNIVGCFYPNSNMRVDVTKTANALQPDDVTLSPNPNNGVFKVNINANAEKEVELLISNKSGKVLTTRKVKLSQGKNSFDFKISEMEGLYILNVVDGNVRFNKQIAKIEEE
jgi:hypothetical protein